MDLQHHPPPQKEVHLLKNLPKYEVIKKNFSEHSFPRNISHGNFFDFCICMNIADCGNHSLSICLMLPDISRSFSTDGLSCDFLMEITNC